MASVRSSDRKRIASYRTIREVLYTKGELVLVLLFVLVSHHDAQIKY